MSIQELAELQVGVYIEPNPVARNSDQGGTLYPITRDPEFLTGHLFNNMSGLLSNTILYIQLLYLKSVIKYTLYKK